MTYEEILEMEKNLVPLNEWADVCAQKSCFTMRTILNGHLSFIDRRIRPDALGSGIVVFPGVHILGEKTTIGCRCVLYPGARIINSRLGDDVQVGGEVVRSKLHEKVIAKHHCYIGDAIISSGSNIGAGVVIANYLGSRKCMVYIGKNVFVGSNATIRGGTRIGDEACIAMNATVTKDVPANAIIKNVNEIAPEKTWHKTDTGWEAREK